MGRSSRASSVGRRVAVALWLALTIATIGIAELSAHRRDEYLQAARLGIEPGRVQIELDLTPGIALADAIIADIDRNRDGRLTADEQRDYATLAISALLIEVDGRRLPVQLSASHFPEVDEMKRGEGVIHLNSSAPIQPLSAGRHRLLFRNGHHAANSVHLANALVPDSDRVAVRAQHRDRDQRELAIDYSLSAVTAQANGIWLVGGITAGVLLVAFLTFILKFDRSRRYAGS